MEALLASGRIADLVLIVLALETAGLVLLQRRRRVAPGPRAILAAALPGAALVIALRFALTDAPWQAIATALAASFALHLIDLTLRLKR